ncbi:MAG: hypothetical protein LJE95_12965 [Acidobacteria bacterium]|jgi:regulator of replication initiation timing|nr:hypothetical protein [Acidobacteriota bacterium]
MKLQGSLSLKLVLVLTIGLALIGSPLLAQQPNQPDVQHLLQKIQELQQQLATQQQHNMALQQKLEELQNTVSALANTQKKQDEAIQQMPEKLAEVSPVKPGGHEKITIKGFISSTFYSQDQNFAFSNGQAAEFPVGSQFTTNKWFSGGDVRNTRLDIGFSGPKLANWTSGGLVETDFFGGFNGSGAFSHQQPYMRLRLAYIQLDKPGTRIRIGQDWSPLFGEWPVSSSHIAFPLGYGSAGFVGWRFPGFYLWHDLSAKGARTKTQLQVGVFEGSWSGPGDNVNGGTAGNVSFRPQVEARLNFSQKHWKIYVVGHWDQKDLKGANDINPMPAITDKITGTAFEIGGMVTPGNWLIHGNAYWGKGIGQQFGAITQFGDISSNGAWLQVGYNFTKNWSLYGFYGYENPNDQDVMDWVGANGRTKNQMYNLHLRYAIGPYWFGLEWLHDKVDLGTAGNSVKGNQLAASWRYVF